jgi:hypothetical protein
MHQFAGIDAGRHTDAQFSFGHLVREFQRPRRGTSVRPEVQPRRNRRATE